MKVQTVYIQYPLFKNSGFHNPESLGSIQGKLEQLRTIDISDRDESWEKEYTTLCSQRDMELFKRQKSAIISFKSTGDTFEKGK